MPSPAYLECESVSKRFPGVQALDGVSLSVPEGSVHALIGENGAGKSTLLKILSGAYAPDSGTIRLAGVPRTFRGTADAFRAGVAIIYQELHLVPQMTVAENILLGHLPNRHGILDRRALRRAALDRLAELDEDIDPLARVGSLPMAQRQMVEIAKALARDAKVIAFDEPTSSLSDREVERLLAVIRDLRDAGRAIVYVSHRLWEVFRVSDSATVFRDGKVAETFDTLEGVTQDHLVSRMVGRAIADVYGYSVRELGPPVLEALRVTGPGLAEPADLTVAAGEVVGLFGLVGAGRTELLRCLCGAAQRTGGVVSVAGRRIGGGNPAAAIRSGIAFCSEDRKRDGIVPQRSVRDNINLSVRRHLARLGVLRPKAEIANAEEFVRQLDIRAASLSQLAGQLSGGNQQKTLLARALSLPIKVLLLDEPTRGIDVGAKSEMYRIIGRLAGQDIGVVVASSELPEVLGISDRIVVMRQGRIVASVPRGEATEEGLLKLALPVAEGVTDE